MGAKTAQLDLRLTDDQKDMIEQASQLAGTTINGWAVSRQQGTRLDQLRRTGQIRPARDQTSAAFPDFGIDSETAGRLFEEFEEEQDRRKY